MRTATARGFEGDDASNHVQSGIDAAQAWAAEHSEAEPTASPSEHIERGGYGFVPSEVLGRWATGVVFDDGRRQSVRVLMGVMMRKPDLVVHAGDLSTQSSSGSTPPTHPGQLN